MDSDEIMRKAGNVMSLISSFDSEMQLNGDSSAISQTSDNDSDMAMQNVYNYREDLPHFSLTHQISDQREQVQQEKYKYLMLKLDVLQEEITKLAGVSSALDNIATNLKCLADSGGMLVHIIKRPRRDDALSLPHQQHDAFLSVVKNCKAVLDHAMWDSNNESINWAVVLPVMRKMADAFKDIAEIVDSTLQDHQLLSNNTVELLQQLARLSFK